MHRWSHFLCECIFSIFLIGHSEISNNFFWVFSMFISAENCTEFIITNQTKKYISTFIRFWMITCPISKSLHFPAYQLVEGASKPRRGARFENIRESASHHARSPRNADRSRTDITLRHTLLCESFTHPFSSILPVALTLCVWVEVLSTPAQCSAAQLKILWIYMFSICRIHIDASLKPFSFWMNFSIFWCVI